MRNLATLRDTGNPLTGQISSVDHDNGSHELLVLHTDGMLLKYELSDCNYIGSPIQRWDIPAAILEENGGEGERDETWFDVTIIRSTGSIVCISHNGNLACIYVDLSTGLHSLEVTCEGEIDSGIVTASWSPEQERVAIVTGNDSLLCMSHSWDVLEEVPIESRTPNSACQLSWRGDGSQFVLQSIDASDDVNYIRVYSNELEILATGRNVADGAASLLKGIGPAVAFAQNGTLIAFPQERIKGKYQIAFIEKNGLRHGDFDLNVPTTVPEGYDGWKVSALVYDSSTTLLAVTVVACKEEDDDDMTGRPSCVQLYYRGNYHWYLKQQYRGLNITCLGFDSELPNRLYLADMLDMTKSMYRLRVIDHGWDISSDVNAKHNATAVGDGDSVLLTPLGYNLVPPPMSLVTLPLVGAYRYACFWPPSSGTSGVAVLCDKPLSAFSGAGIYPSICLTLLDSKGIPLKDANNSVICLYEALQSLQAFQEGEYASLLDSTSTSTSKLSSNRITFRSITVMEIESGVLAICVLMNIVHDDSSSSTSKDHAIVLYYDMSKGEMHQEYNSNESQYMHEIHVEDEGADVCEGYIHHIQPWYLHTTITNGDGHDENDNDDGKNNSNRCAAFGVVKRKSDLGSGCEVLPIPLDTCQDLSLLSVQSTDKQEALLRLPEDCSKVTILTTIHSRDQEVVYMALGLTDKNRLYCGEMLLVAGASSFLVNESLQMVLYITVGAQPKLHYLSFSSLSTLDPTQSFDHPDNMLVEFAESRPVERGARLVCSPYGSPKIIVQQPRGNLEGFEPRALVLLQARSLMDKVEYYQVMVMFRRQKIDLNLLIDHNPSLFLQHCDQFVAACIENSTNKGTKGSKTNQTGIEMLALLITGLSAEDVTMTKYPNPAPTTSNTTSNDNGTTTVVGVMGDDSTKEGKAYTEGQKLNTVCTVLRTSLLKQLNLPRDGDDGSDGTVNTAAVTPLLCTFAKQDPPLLEKALMLIREIACATSSTSSSTSSDDKSNSTALLSTTAQGHIKYLAFLADSQQIFDAALGCCDFYIAKAIARQCQMDPKVYLPLINEFQAIGEGHSNDSIYAYLMHIAVNKHLDRYMKIIDYCLLAISAYYTSNESTRVAVDNEERGLEYITSTILSIVREYKCYIYILPRLTQQYTTLCTQNDKSMAQYREHLSVKVLSPCRLGYATYLMSQYSQSPSPDIYHQAMSYYLSTSPISIIDAVTTARRVNDWPTLISLVTRYDSMFVSLKKPEWNVKRVVADMIDEYEGTIEQGDMYAMDITNTVINANNESILQSPTHYHLSAIDNVSYIASLCIIYLQDVERAVSILLTTRRFSEAITIAMQQSRVDLIEDDIKSALMTESEASIESLTMKSEKIIEIVGKLKEIWIDPARRLEEVKEKEPWAKRELDWISQGCEGVFDSTKDYDGMGSDVDDTKSDYSAITGRSDMSFVSQTSIISLLSNSSDSSALSRQSGSSTVSILSDMGSVSSGNNNDISGKGNEFAIAGLEHTLLSKGTGDGDMGNNRAGRAKREGKKKDKYDYDKMVEKNGGQPLTKKQLRRVRRGENAGRDYRGHRDMLGLGKESALCAELMSIAQGLESMCTICSDLCHAHILIGQHSVHYNTGVSLTKAMNALCTTMRQNPPNIAPAYPTLWLQERDYTAIMYFQDNQQQQDIPSSAIQLNQQLENKRKKYWESAAKGISFWHSKMKLSLFDLPSTTSDEKGEERILL